MTAFWPQIMPKWSNFDHFHQIWHILTKLTPLMTFLTKLLSVNLDLFLETFREKIFEQFLQILTYDVILAPKYAKMTLFWPYSPKIPILTKWTPLMIFVSKFMSINRTEINFRNLYGINGDNVVKRAHFWWKRSKLDHFGGQNDAIGQNLGRVVINCFLKSFLNLFQSGVWT